MAPERASCPTHKTPARLIQMTCKGDIYDCKHGHRFTIPVSKEMKFDCFICQDTKIVGEGDPCPHCEDREFLNSVARW